MSYIDTITDEQVRQVQSVTISQRKSVQEPDAFHLTGKDAEGNVVHEADADFVEVAGAGLAFKALGWTEGEEASEDSTHPDGTDYVFTKPAAQVPETFAA